MSAGESYMGKILIVGGDGFLGSNLLWYAKQENEVVATTRSFPFRMKGCQVETLDIRNRDMCAEVIQRHEPDVVMNTAAVLSLDMAERDRDLAREIHVQGAINLLDACKKTNAKIVYVSSDFVFDGNREVGYKYLETDEPRPLNYYGVTKLEGEGVVRESGLGWIVARTAHIYGINAVAPFVDDAGRQRHMAERSSYAVTVANTLRKGQAVIQPSGLYQTPVLASDFSQAVLSLLKLNAEGIYHVCGSDCVSRYQFYKQLARTFDLDASLVKDASVEECARSFNVPASILPRRACMSVKKVEERIGRKMVGVEEGLKLLRSQVEHGLH